MGDLPKYMFYVYVIITAWRIQKDDFIREKINEIWNQIEIQTDGNVTEEEEMEKRMEELEKDPTYRELKDKLDDLYNKYGDMQENIEGKIPFSCVLDFWDPVKDETKTRQKKRNTHTGWVEVQDDIVSIYEGKIDKINYEVKYKQHMLAVRDFRRKVVVGNLSPADTAEILRKEGDTDSKNIRIVYTYDYTNYYANDLDKIDTSSPADIEITDTGVKLTKTIKVYQDSFSAIPSPNVDSETPKVQLGFIFKEDPLRTYEEFCQAARDAMNRIGPTGRTDVRGAQKYYNDSYEYAKTHNDSPNSVSYFQSENYLNDHKNLFIDTDNKMIKANNKDAVQTAFALWCRDVYLDVKETIFNSGDEGLNKIKEAYENKFNRDIKIEYDIIVQVGECNYADRSEETKYEEIKLSEVKWPEDIQDIKKVRYELPSIGGKAKEIESEIISESELEKKKKEVISGDAGLPQINDGEISAEEEKTYTIYDWKSIEEDLEIKKEGRRNTDMKELHLAKQPQKTYFARKGKFNFYLEDIQTRDVFGEDFGIMEL